MLLLSEGPVLGNFMCRAGRRIAFVIALMSLLFGGVAQVQSPQHDQHGAIPADSAHSPTVFLQVIPLSGGGYNVRIQTLNFIWTPQNVDGPPVLNEGHAHLYVDGEKVARIYGEWYHLGGLPENAETVKVTLYANDHSHFTVDGEMVSDSVSVDAITPAD